MGFLQKIFGGKKQLEPIDLSVLKTDLHSHFIPGIDDGSKSIEESLELITEFKNLGYSKVITTPHVIPDTYNNSNDTIRKGLDQVRETLAKHNIDIQVEAAAEHYMDHDLLERIQQKDLMTFGNNHVLFELPFVSEPPMLNKAIFEMQMAGYKPVLAHAERYTFWYSSYEKYQELKDKEVLIQMNILSLAGHYSPMTQKIAERMVKDGLVDILGSDCHNMFHVDAIKNARTMPGVHELIQSGNLINASL